MNIHKLRSLQQQFVEHLTKAVDFFVVLPTGYGKSLCYVLAPYVNTAGPSLPHDQSGTVAEGTAASGNNIISNYYYCCCEIIIIIIITTTIMYVCSSNECCYFIIIYLLLRRAIRPSRG